MATKAREALLDPMLEKNPILLQVLGICPALAITTLVENAIAMTLATTAVLVVSNVVVSMLRHFIPDSVRIIIYLTVVASLVIIADQVLAAFFFELSVQLSVYVGLIITNCIVLGRAESFASQNGVWASAMDGLGNGIGYGIVLTATAFIRELLGSGQILGQTIIETTESGGSFHAIGLLSAPAGAFFVVMVLVWILRGWKSHQAEEA